MHYVGETLICRAQRVVSRSIRENELKVRTPD